MSWLSAGLASLFRSISHPTVDLPKTASEIQTGLSFLETIEPIFAALPEGNVKNTATSSLVKLSSDLQTAAFVTALGESVTSPGAGAALAAVLSGNAPAVPSASVATTGIGASNQLPPSPMNIGGMATSGGV